jgi:hypothetical protein
MPCADAPQRGTIMKALQVIQSSSFAPEALVVIYQAFDAAWEQMRLQVGPDPSDIEVARRRLAHAVLDAARGDLRDAAALTDAALLIYRTGPAQEQAS